MSGYLDPVSVQDKFSQSSQTSQSIDPAYFIPCVGGDHMTSHDCHMTANLARRVPAVKEDSSTGELPYC